MNSTFAECTSFNQNIQIPDGVTQMPSTFWGCTSLNQNILIPNSVTNLSQTFQGCTSLNQNILIPSSVTEMGFAFNGCTSLNQPDMYIYSQNVIDMGNAFGGCNVNNIHIPGSVPKDTSNYMYNCLVNGNTGITFPAANIFNDLLVGYESVPSYWDDSHKYTRYLIIAKDENGNIIRDENGTIVRINVWKNSNESLAASGFYLLVDNVSDTNGNQSYNVRLCNPTFDSNGVTSDEMVGTLYKQDYTNIDSLYIANGQSYEPLLLGQNVTLPTNPVNTDCIYRSVMYNN